MSADFELDENWLNDLVQGRGTAAEDFVAAFGPGLEKIAASNMTPALQQRVGADDVFQSVCRTFLRRAAQGQFAVPDRDSLWRLLCAITLNKVRMQARFHSAQRRGRMESTPLEAGDARQTGVTAEQAVEFADEFAKLLESLPEAEGRIIRLKLDGHSHTEIATKLQCTERTVGRLLVKARAALASMLEE
ncbi:MAG: sigma-70 family RNA polymerase sigma factor [Planctomycetaceae bacterium]|nr:sigma-70 family RNA polymerase sigma factor [Planctomycetaceae bacterium]